ncbi:MAG: hypothetical protein Kow0029_28700 [Candidatus Rifleibacteriota bacterium]
MPDGAIVLPAWQSYKTNKMATLKNYTLPNSKNRYFIVFSNVGLAKFRSRVDYEIRTGSTNDTAR